MIGCEIRHEISKIDRGRLFQGFRHCAILGLHGHEFRVDVPGDSEGLSPTHLAERPEPEIHSGVAPEFGPRQHNEESSKR